MVVNVISQSVLSFIILKNNSVRKSKSNDIRKSKKSGDSARCCIREGDGKNFCERDGNYNALLTICKFEFSRLVSTINADTN